MKTLCFLFWATCAFASFGCIAEDIDLEKMDSSERAFQEDRAQMAFAYMSLEAMFPRAEVRDLAEAARKGRIEKIGELVSQGLDVNSQGTKGATPLFWALRNDGFQGFEKLLALGADPNLVFSNTSVMHWAAMHEDTRFLKAALRYGGDPNLRAGRLSETPIFKTIGVGSSGNREALGVLIDAGADVNAVAKGELFGRAMGGKTPLLSAANVGRFDIVYALLEQGADYQIEDVNGLGLVDYVVDMREASVPGSDAEEWLERVMDWLLDHGVDIPRA